MRFVAMNSPVVGRLFPLYLAALTSVSGAASAQGQTWWSVSELRRTLGTAEGKVVAHWTGPEASQPDAAFLAVHVGASGVRSIVALKEGIRIRFDGRTNVEGRKEAHPVTSLDLDGVRLADWVVLFHSEAGLLRSAFSFDTGPVNASSLRYVITGVAPGVWEIWRDGWVVDIGVVVRAGEGVLYFSERPGSFFVRRLN
jgi:hypothetical protein